MPFDFTSRASLKRKHTQAESAAQRLAKQQRFQLPQFSDIHDEISRAFPSEVYSNPDEYAPRNGRFSNEMADAADRSCESVPIVDRDAAIAEGMEIMRQRRQYQNDLYGPDDEVHVEPAQVDLNTTDDDKDDDCCSSMWSGLVSSFDEAKEQAEEHTRIYARSDLAVDPFISSQVCDGDLKVERIRTLLASMGLTRSQHQRLFHDTFIRAMLPKIYGTEWGQHSQRVMRTLGIKRIRSEVAILTPRQFGKTTSVSMYAAAVMLACPGIRILVFSPGQRTSSNLMLSVIAHIKKFPNGEARIIKNNNEQLFLAATPRTTGKKGVVDEDTLADQSVSTLRSLPAATSSQSKSKDSSPFFSLRTPKLFFSGQSQFHTRRDGQPERIRPRLRRHTEWLRIRLDTR